MSPQAVRPLALTAMLGGTLYVIAGLVQLTSPEQSDPFSRMFDYLIEVPLALSLLLTLAGFVALYLLRAGGYRGLRGSTAFARSSSGRVRCSLPQWPLLSRARRPWVSSILPEPSCSSWG